MLDLLKKYFLKRADLLKMEATEKAVAIAGTAAYLVFAMFFGVFFLILLLVGLGLLLGSYLNNYGLGVLIIAGVCLLIIVLTFLLRKKIKNAVANKIIQSLDSES